MKKGISRRKFVASTAIATTAAIEFGRGTAVAQDTAKASTSAAKSAAHRPPHAKFNELPVAHIEPQGWLKAFLATQSKGLTGNLDKTGGFPFNTFGWAGPQMSDV